MFEKLVNKKNYKINFAIIPKTNEEHNSVTYGCRKFSDIYRFLSSGLGKLIRALVDNSHKTLFKI